METEKIALEIINLTIKKSEDANEILNKHEGQAVIERVKRIDERLIPIVEKNQCKEPCSKKCTEPTRRIVIYALQQATNFRNQNYPENSSLNENIEWNKRIEEQLTRFEQIYENLSQVDFGVHPSESEESLINTTSDSTENISNS